MPSSHLDVTSCSSLKAKPGITVVVNAPRMAGTIAVGTEGLSFCLLNTASSSLSRRAWKPALSAAVGKACLWSVPSVDVEPGFCAKYSQLTPRAEQLEQGRWRLHLSFFSRHKRHDTGFWRVRRGGGPLDWTGSIGGISVDEIPIRDNREILARVSPYSYSPGRRNSSFPLATNPIREAEQESLRYDCMYPVRSN